MSVDTPVSATRALREQRAATRRDPAVRAIIRAWRELTQGDAAGGTLVACSGGADSSALAIALSATGGRIILAHVLHDLRASHQAAADRDRTRDLAVRLGVPFVESAVAVTALAGNIEANARRARYAALAGLARDRACPFVATAHHAGDQAESVLMHLLRGAGPRGLSGIAVSRSLGRGGIRLIRPMLAATRADAERICRNFGWTWCVDATNDDTGRVRANVRLRALPALAAVISQPGLERRIAGAAANLADAAGLVDDAADALWAMGKPDHESRDLVWPRGVLRPARQVVLDALIRRASARLTNSRRLDRAASRAMVPCLRAIRDNAGEPRTFRVAALIVTVTARTVRVSTIDP